MSAAVAVWRIKVVWKDGEENYLRSAGGLKASFPNKEKAEKFRDFMLEGMEDEVQSINVVREPREGGKGVGQ